MSKKIELEELAFELEMLTELFVALGEAMEHSKVELPKHFLFLPIQELERISKKINSLVL